MATNEMVFDAPDASLNRQVLISDGSLQNPSYIKLQCMIEKYQKSTLPEQVDHLITIWNEVCKSGEQLPRVEGIFQLVYRETCHLVFSDIWRDVAQASKRKLAYAVTQCGDKLKTICERIPKLSSALVLAIYDPWCELEWFAYNEKSNFQQPNNENVKKFLLEEPMELIRIRVEYLLRSGKENGALQLCATYLNIHSQNCNTQDETQGIDLMECENPTSKEPDRLPLLELLVFMLFRKKRMLSLLKAACKYNCCQGLKLIQSVEKSKEPGSFLLAQILTHLFLGQDLHFPSHYGCTKDLMRLWCFLYSKNTPTKVQNAAKKLMIRHASNSAHFYLFVDVLWEQFGYSLLPLYLELYVLGLTTDMNHLDVVRSSQSHLLTIELEAHIAGVFCKLASLFGDGHEVFAREFILSAFSLEPTYERLLQLDKFTQCVEKQAELVRTIPKQEPCNETEGLAFIIQEQVQLADPTKELKTEKKPAACACEGRCSTPDLPSSLYEFKHPILDHKLQGISDNLQCDLVTVVEGLRHFPMRSPRPWNVLRPVCETHLKAVSALHVIHKSSRTYNTSSDSETDSKTEADSHIKQKYLKSDDSSFELPSENEPNFVACKEEASSERKKFIVSGNLAITKRKKKKKRKSKKDKDKTEVTPKKKVKNPQKSDILNHKNVLQNQVQSVSNPRVSALMFDHPRIILDRLDLTEAGDVASCIPDNVSESSLRPINEIQTTVQATVGLKKAKGKALSSKTLKVVCDKSRTNLKCKNLTIGEKKVTKIVKKLSLKSMKKCKQVHMGCQTDVIVVTRVPAVTITHNPTFIESDLSKNFPSTQNLIPLKESFLPPSKAAVSCTTDTWTATQALYRKYPTQCGTSTSEVTVPKKTVVTSSAKIACNPTSTSSCSNPTASSGVSVSSLLSVPTMNMISNAFRPTSKKVLSSGTPPHIKSEPTSPSKNKIVTIKQITSSGSTINSIPLTFQTNRGTLQIPIRNNGKIFSKYIIPVGESSSNSSALARLSNRIFTQKPGTTVASSMPGIIVMQPGSSNVQIKTEVGKRRPWTQTKSNPGKFIFQKALNKEIPVVQVTTCTIPSSGNTTLIINKVVPQNTSVTIANTFTSSAFLPVLPKVTSNTLKVSTSNECVAKVLPDSTTPSHFLVKAKESILPINLTNDKALCLVKDKRSITKLQTNLASCAIKAKATQQPLKLLSTILQKPLQTIDLQHNSPLGLAFQASGTLIPNILPLPSTLVPTNLGLATLNCESIAKIPETFTSETLGSVVSQATFTNSQVIQHFGSSVMAVSATNEGTITENKPIGILTTTASNSSLNSSPTLLPPGGDQPVNLKIESTSPPIILKKPVKTKRLFLVSNDKKQLPVKKIKTESLDNKLNILLDPSVDRTSKTVSDTTSMKTDVPNKSTHFFKSNTLQSSGSNSTKKNAPCSPEEVLAKLESITAAAAKLEQERKQSLQKNDGTAFDNAALAKKKKKKVVVEVETSPTSPRDMTMKVVCKDCGRSLATTYNLRRHMQNIHHKNLPLLSQSPVGSSGMDPLSSPSFDHSIPQLHIVDDEDPFPFPEEPFPPMLSPTPIMSMDRITEGCSSESPEKASISDVISQPLTPSVFMQALNLSSNYSPALENAPTDSCTNIPVPISLALEMFTENTAPTDVSSLSKQNCAFVDHSAEAVMPNKATVGHCDSTTLLCIKEKLNQRSKIIHLPLSENQENPLVIVNPTVEGQNHNFLSKTNLESNRDITECSVSSWIQNNNVIKSEMDCVNTSFNSNLGTIINNKLPASGDSDWMQNSNVVVTKENAHCPNQDSDVVNATNANIKIEIQEPSVSDSIPSSEVNSLDYLMKNNLIDLFCERNDVNVDLSVMTAEDVASGLSNISDNEKFEYSLDLSKFEAINEKAAFDNTQLIKSKSRCKAAKVKDSGNFCKVKKIVGSRETSAVRVIVGNENEITSECRVRENTATDNISKGDVLNKTNMLHSVTDPASFIPSSVKCKYGSSTSIDHAILQAEVFSLTSGTPLGSENVSDKMENSDFDNFFSHGTDEPNVLYSLPSGSKTEDINSTSQVDNYYVEPNPYTNNIDNEEFSKASSLETKLEQSGDIEVSICEDPTQRVLTEKNFSTSSVSLPTEMQQLEEKDFYSNKAHNLQHRNLSCSNMAPDMQIPRPLIIMPENCDTTHCFSKDYSSDKGLHLEVLDLIMEVLDNLDHPVSKHSTNSACSQTNLADSQQQLMFHKETEQYYETSDSIPKLCAISVSEQSSLISLKDEKSPEPTMNKVSQLNYEENFRKNLNPGNNLNQQSTVVEARSLPCKDNMLRKESSSGKTKRNAGKRRLINLCSNSTLPQASDCEVNITLRSVVDEVHNMELRDSEVSKQSSRNISTKSKKICTPNLKQVDSVKSEIEEISSTEVQLEPSTCSSNNQSAVESSSNRSDSLQYSSCQPDVFSSRVCEKELIKECAKSDVLPFGSSQQELNTPLNHITPKMECEHFQEVQNVESRQTHDPVVKTESTSPCDNSFFQSEKTSVFCRNFEQLKMDTTGTADVLSPKNNNDQMVAVRGSSRIRENKLYSKRSCPCCLDPPPSPLKKCRKNSGSSNGSNGHSVLVPVIPLVPIKTASSKPVLNLLKNKRRPLRTKSSIHTRSTTVKTTILKSPTIKPRTRSRIVP